MTYPWPTLMPMGIVVISCVRPSVQLSMGLGLCIAYKALGRNGLQFGMLMYPDGLHSAFMDAYGYCCWSVCPSICPFVRLRHFQVAVHLLTNHLELSQHWSKGYSCHVMHSSMCPTVHGLGFVHCGQIAWKKWPTNWHAHVSRWLMLSCHWQLWVLLPMSNHLGFFFLRLGLGQRRAVVIIGRWLLPSLVDTGDICCHYWQHILVPFGLWHQIPPYFLVCKTYRDLH